LASPPGPGVSWPKALAEEAKERGSDLFEEETYSGEQLPVVLSGLGGSELQFWLMGLYVPKEGALVNDRPVYQHSSKKAYLVYAERANRGKHNTRKMYWWVSHQDCEFGLVDQSGATEDEMSGWLRIEHDAQSPDQIEGAWEAADGRGGWINSLLKIQSAAEDINAWVVAL
jgi:hypothetical protein